jgi:hypothetical protein
MVEMLIAVSLFGLGMGVWAYLDGRKAHKHP